MERHRKGGVGGGGRQGEKEINGETDNDGDLVSVRAMPAVPVGSLSAWETKQPRNDSSALLERPTPPADSRSPRRIRQPVRYAGHPFIRRGESSITTAGKSLRGGDSLREMFTELL